MTVRGASPFAHLRISDRNLRLRVEQELRNLSLRLRRRYVACVEDTAALVASLTATIVPLAVVGQALLHLVGQPVVDESPEAVFAGLAGLDGIDGAELDELLALTPHDASAAQVRAVYSTLAATLDAAVAIADSLE